MTAGYTFLDYWEYSRIQHASPEPWALLASGQGLAPAQYRIGVYYSANFVAHLTHLQLRHIFALSDAISTTVSLACILFLLIHIPRFERAAPSAQWAQVLLALLLAQIYLMWTLWFQEPETMPSLAVLAVSVVLYRSLTQDTTQVQKAMLSLLLFAVLGATIRVDIVTASAAGMFVAGIDSRNVRTGKAWLIGTSLAALAAALAIEYLIAHRLFPHAVRSAPAFQLVENLHSVNGTLALACTLPPWLLTAWLAARNWSALPIWGRGLIVGSVFHFLMFLTFGMSEEVRIFLPFTMVVIPFSATLLYAWFVPEETAKTRA